MPDSPITNTDVAVVVGAYAAAHPDERPALEPLLARLADPAPVTSRKTVPIHVTCGALAVTPDGRLLQVLHKTFGTWLPPGGHVEPDDESLVATALREMAEETGVDGRSATEIGTAPVDVHHHPVPPRPARNEPAHTHYDLRYLVRLPHQPVRVEPSEARAVRWVPLVELPGRLGDKLRALA